MKPATTGAPATAPKGIPADLLKQASQVPNNVKVESFNPMEDIPTLGVGEELEKGMTISGYFEATEELASTKFKFSQTRNAQGVPTQLRHILRVGSPTGKRIAIWSTGELRNAFSKLTAGDFIAVTYKGKGLNANQQEQHFFDYQRGVSAPAVNQ